MGAMETTDRIVLTTRLGICLALSLFLVAACGRPEILTGVGTGGRYLQGKEEVTRRRGGNLDKAIISLETVVKEDPTYKDSLTLLGRAYYMKQRYQDAFQILQRALAVNPEDEIAWLVLGITELRIGDDEKGLQALQGGITLFSKVSQRGYKGFRYWDRSGRVKTAARRCVLVLRSGFEGKKEERIQTVENLLAAIDAEEWQLSTEQEQDFRRLDRGVGGR
jgi:tetratricopeptide (TPR) repeat protein